MGGYVFSSIEKQIEILKGRGMIVENETLAKDFLLFNNYYNVVNALKHYILDPNAEEEKYRAGIRFEHLICLFEFDSSLRALFLKYLLVTELGLKTHLAYEIAKTYGPFGYLCQDAYNSSRPKNIAYASELVMDLKRLIEENTAKSDMVKHFVIQKKSGVPLWALINILDFGMLRRLYQNVNSNVSCRVARNYYSLPARALFTMICSLNVWRNLSAHGNCLIRFRMKDYTKQICDTPLHAYLDVPKEGPYYRSGKRDLFSIVICFKYLLKPDDFSDFIFSLKKEILALGKNMVSAPVDVADILNEIGVPSPFESEGRRLWKKLADVSVTALGFE